MEGPPQSGETHRVNDATPLAGIRVIDLGTRVAAPFCAALLAELGADVIKIEQPGSGDAMRSVGPFVGHESLFFAVEDRDRRSVTCDLHGAAGQALARRLIETADVVVENFRPGTLERWHLGPADLPTSLVFVRISVFGQTGPDADRPGLDLVALAATGLLELTGYPDGPPVKSSVTIADHLTGVFAAQAAVAALVQRRRTGRGAVIDAPLHASVLRCLNEVVVEQQSFGYRRQRNGGRGPHERPSGVYATADDRFVALVVEPESRDALAALVRGLRSTKPGGHDPTPLDENELAAWIASVVAAEAVDRLRHRGLACSVVHDAGDIGVMAVVVVDDPVLGPLPQPAPYPFADAVPAHQPRGAPRLGEHNQEVWCDELGLSQSELDQLIANGVI